MHVTKGYAPVRYIQACRGIPDGLGLGEMKTVRLTQYIRPYGTPREVTTQLEDEIADKAEEMELSCEVLTTGEVAIYARLKTQDEEDELLELATNTPGPNEPDVVLARLINKVWEIR